MHAIIKPEMRNCLDLFEPYMASKGFQIFSKHPIPSWSEFARDFYARQIKESKKFEDGFNQGMQLINQYFGDNAALVMLGNNEDDFLKIKELSRLKKEFRVYLSSILPQPSKELAMADCLKYIHVPDPNLETLERERQVIAQKGILNSRIDDCKWKEMIQKNTLSLEDLA